MSSLGVETHADLNPTPQAAALASAWCGMWSVIGVSGLSGGIELHSYVGFLGLPGDLLNAP